MEIVSVALSIGRYWAKNPAGPGVEKEIINFSIGPH